MRSQYFAKASHRESGVWVQIPVFALTTAREEIHELFYMQKSTNIFLCPAFPYMRFVASYVLSTELL